MYLLMNFVLTHDFINLVQHTAITICLIRLSYQIGIVLQCLSAFKPSLSVWFGHSFSIHCYLVFSVWSESVLLFNPSDVIDL